jgi:hypothetical protein
LTVKAVIKPQIDQFAQASVPRTCGELIEILDSFSRKLQYPKEHDEQKVAI